MRPCFNIYCDNGKEVEYSDEDTKIVTDEDCHICYGTGEVEDYCYCSAYEPNECICGAWDDVRTSWYEEDYNYNKDEEEE